MIMLDENILNKEWVQDLNDSQFRMWIALLLMASKKTGIIECNMRTINFMANCSHKFTKEELLTTYGNRIQLIPGHDDKMIIVNYITTNWLKDGRAFDPVCNKLDKAIEKELSHYGLTIEKLNEMASNKITVADNGDSDSDELTLECEELKTKKKDVRQMFDEFWKRYPSCSRKVDRKKCCEKFSIIMRDEDDPEALLNVMLCGLDAWIKSDEWHREDGRFICAPLVWLNQQRWETKLDYNPNEVKKFVKQVFVKVTDWELCKERCVNCNGSCCKCGMKMPPQMRERPIAPEECQNFKPL